MQRQLEAWLEGEAFRTQEHSCYDELVTRR
jgi:hypothetical protein